MTVFEILTAELPAIILTLKLSLITCFFLFLIGTPLALLLAYKINLILFLKVFYFAFSFTFNSNWFLSFSF